MNLRAPDSIAVSTECGSLLDPALNTQSNEDDNNNKLSSKDLAASAQWIPNFSLKGAFAFLIFVMYL